MITQKSTKGYTRKILFFSTILLFLTSFIYIAKVPKPLKIGKKAPLSSMKMVSTNGDSLTLDSLKLQKGLLVVFSCNTCPFVVGTEDFAGWEKQYNDLNALAMKSNVGMVLINSNEAKREGDDSMLKMKERAKLMKYSMPYLLDKESKLADAFGAKTTPHVFLFDQELKLIFAGSIDNSWDTQKTQDELYLVEALNEINENKNITVKNSLPRGCSIKRK